MRNLIVALGVLIIGAGCSDPVAPEQNFDGTYVLESVSNANEASGQLHIIGDTFTVSYTVNLIDAFPVATFETAGSVLRMPNPNYVRFSAEGWTNTARINGDRLTTDTSFGDFVWRRM